MGLEEAPPEEVEKADQLRTLLSEMIQEHEQNEHGGEICHENRVGVIAFLLHSIGVTGAFVGPYLLDVARAVIEYDQAHEERHGPTNGNGGEHLH